MNDTTPASVGPIWDRRWARSPIMQGHTLDLSDGVVQQIAHGEREMFDQSFQVDHEHSMARYVFILSNSMQYRRLTALRKRIEANETDCVLFSFEHGKILRQRADETLQQLIDSKPCTFHKPPAPITVTEKIDLIKTHARHDQWAKFIYSTSEEIDIHFRQHQGRKPQPAEKETNA